MTIWLITWIKRSFTYGCVFFCSASLAQPFEYQTNQDIYMIGDVHGAYQEFEQILRQAKLVDEQLNWIGGKAHFVSTGDLMSRGPSSRKVMDLLIKLQAQAEQEGGKVHVLLGNHEVFNLTGDWRYNSPEEFAEFTQDETSELRNKYFERHKKLASITHHSEQPEDFNKRFAQGFFARLEALSPAGKYGEWLHSLPFIIKINQHVFTHGGLSVETQTLSLADLNNQLKEELVDYTHAWKRLIDTDKLSGTLDYSLRQALVNRLRKNSTTRKFLRASRGLLYSTESPTWYRGNAMCHPLFETQILDQSLANFAGTRLWVGHTASTTVRQRFDKKLMLMDAGMLKPAYNGSPIYVHIKNGSMNPQDWNFVNAENEQNITPIKVAVRRSLNPKSMTDVETEALLSTATIVSADKLGEGITNPLKVELEQNGTRVTAVFKYFDSGRLNSQSKRTINDRYQYEVASYKLDRLMGLKLVPVTVERTVDGNRGVLQLWIDDLINYKAMEDNDIKYDGYCNYTRQRQMLDVFDYLIRNDDRNQTNIAFTLDDWQLWFIDHTRAFDASTVRPKLLKDADLTLTPEFRKILGELTEENLRPLSEWLSKRQIRYMLKRRDKLLAGDA